MIAITSRALQKEAIAFRQITPTTRPMSAPLRGLFAHGGVERCLLEPRKRDSPAPRRVSANDKSSLSAIRENQPPRCHDQNSLPIFLSSEQRPAPRKNMAT